MSFRFIQWLAVLLPTLIIGLFEFLRHQLLARTLPDWMAHGWLGNVIGALAVAAIVFVFVRLFAGFLRRSALEATWARKEAAVIVERQRNGREMHDGVAQALFYLKVKLREVGDLMAVGESEQARGELRAAEEGLEDTSRRVRAVISDLKRQAELEHFGEAVHRATTELAERLGVQMVCEAEACPQLPAATQKHLLAIIEEAMNNANRHGHAGSARVSVKACRGNVTVQISDDGAGFDLGSVPRDGRYGLTVMEERVQMVGGRLRLDSAPGRGTRVTVSLPAEATEGEKPRAVSYRR